MSEAPDLLIVGGGPAGLATAIEARLAGLEATVIDRRRPPIDVACGEGLMPAGVDHLHRLGVKFPESKSGMFSGIRYLDGEVEAVARFRSGAGLGVRRTTLHRAMVHRADDLGVGFLWGTAVRGLEDNEVLTDRGSFGGRVVVAADGRLSRLRRMAGIATSVPGQRRFGVRRHYRRVPWTETVDVFWADEGEAYVTPVGPEMIGVAMLSRTKPLDFDHQLRHFPELLRRLDGAEVTSSDRGAGPFGHRPEAVIRGRLALVGDASGSLDPITGEGVSVAFSEARALVRAVKWGALDDYAVEHRRIMRAPGILTDLLLLAERHPNLRRLTIRALAALPCFFSMVVDRIGRSGANGSRASTGRPMVRSGEG